MFIEEKRIVKNIKIGILLLITLLGVSLISETFTIVILLFYIAFMKE